MRKSVFCLVAIMVFVLFSLPVMAEESMEQRVKSLEDKIKKLEESKPSVNVLKLFEGLELSGFVDTSYVYDDNSGSSSFSLDEFELDIEKTLSNRASLRADINFRKVDYDDGDSFDFDDIMEQGYITYTAPIGDDMTFTFGKFNAPIGFELLDAPDMYQFSHALVFDYGLPTNLTGLMSSFDIGKTIDVTLYVVNGWDVSSDNNTDKTVGGRIGFTPVENINFGISGIYGAEKDDNNHDKRSVIDLDATITPLESLLIGAEFNYGTEDEASLKDAEHDADWFGTLIMAHYDFTGWMGLTVRYDYFDDKEGSRIGLVEGGVDIGEAVKMQALTIAPTFTIADGAGFLVEYRYDFADKDYFEDADGKYKNNNHTVALEFTYSF